ncbi:MAG TPA: hypothetical protein VGF67_09615 [Ktedonobacteraceae bacterium]
MLAGPTLVVACGAGGLWSRLCSKTDKAVLAIGWERQLPAQRGKPTPLAGPLAVV